MQTFKKTAAQICAVLFVTTAAMAMLLFTIEQRALSPNTYKQAFRSQKLYERMPSVLALAVTSSIAEDPGADPYLKVLSREDWERALAPLLPPEELKTLTDSAIDAIFDYLNGKTDSASVSLLPFKRNLVGASGVEAFKQIINAQPPCSEEQLMQMGLNLISGGELILCSPPAETLDLFAPMIETQLQFMILTFPDEIVLVKGTSGNLTNDPRIGLNKIRRFMRLTPIVPLLLLFGLTLLAVRSLADWLKWWGVPFIASGMIGFLAALIGSPLLRAGFQRSFQNQGANALPPVLANTVQDAVGAVIRQIMLPVMIEGVILLALGIGMVVAAKTLLRKEKTSIQNQ